MDNLTKIADVLIGAYFRGELRKWNCEMCAIENLIYSLGFTRKQIFRHWHNELHAHILRPDDIGREHLNLVERNYSIGFSNMVLIEKSFEVSKNAFDGLCNVFDYLCNEVFPNTPEVDLFNLTKELEEVI